MISIENSSNYEISIIFDNMSQKEKSDIINTIVNIFANNQNYFFSICGLDADNFLEDISSKQYILVTDRKHKFIKDLPELYVMTTYLSDVSIFNKYIGSFNEGSMCFYILNSNVKDPSLVINANDIEQMLEYVYDNSLLTIDITSDSDVLVVNCNDSQKLNLICDEICNKF